MTAPCVHLHVHSNFSLLEGACRSEEIVAAAARMEMSAVALTDRNALYGAMAFYDQCAAAGVKPVIGMELQVGSEHGLLLLAAEQEGYRNLCRLSSLLQAAPERERALIAGVTWDELDRYRAGLIALTDGRRGAVEAALRRGNPQEAAGALGRLADLYGREQVFVELQINVPEDQNVAIRLALLAREAGAHCVASHDVHYIDPDGAERQRILAAMGGSPHAAPDGAFFLSPPEMLERFQRFPAALEQTLAIAERCRVAFPEHRLIFPEVELPTGVAPAEQLRRQAWAGLAARFGAPAAAAEERLARELSVINDLGYAQFFLAVADIVQFARQADIPFSSRGSASSSLVVYALGISDVDPLRHDLYFERFLNRGRREAPDIDIDFCSKRRDEVIDFVFRRFGRERVAMVSTYSTLRARSALRETAKVLGVPEARIAALAAQIPHYWHPGMGAEVRQAQENLLAQLADPAERKALEIAGQLDGYPHHLSVHAGGVVIAPGPITDWVAVQHAPKGIPITQWDGPAVERLGLLKIDLLGIRGLSVVQSAVEKVRRGREPAFDITRIPDGDAATGELLAQGRTLGCFQIESSGIQETLRQLGVRDTAGVIAAISLYRPGPLRGGLKDAFVRRYVGQEPVEYLHPALEPILRETLGVVLFQEQVLRIAHEFAGFTLEQADGLRRAMTKFRSHGEMARLKGDFLRGAATRSGAPAAGAERIWELMQSFAGYGFPKAHAAGYAVVAYRCAYLKAHYPAEFMAARLSEWGGYYGQRVYLSEARRLGLTLRPPHVSHSRREFTLAYEAGRPILWMGLDQVKDVTRRTVERTLEERERGPFESWDDWLARVAPRQKEATNLARVGALDGLGASRPAIITQLGWSARHAGAGQLRLPLGIDPDEPAVSLDPAEQMRVEEELLGVAVSRHPLEAWQPALRQYRPTPSAQLGRFVGREVVVAGLRVASWRHRTKAGALMCFLTLEDVDGIIEVVIFPEVYQQCAAALRAARPFVVWGHVQSQRDHAAGAGSARPPAEGCVVVARRVLALAGPEG